MLKRILAMILFIMVLVFPAQAEESDAEKFYAHLTDVVVPEIGLASREELRGEHGYDEEFWSNMLMNGPAGLLSAIVDDFDQDGATDMLTVEITERSYALISETQIYFTVELALYQIVDGVVTETDRLTNAVEMIEYHRETRFQIPISITRLDDKTYLHAYGTFTAGLSYDGGSSTACVISGGKFTEFDTYLPTGTFVTQTGAEYKPLYTLLAGGIDSDREFGAINPGNCIALINYDFYYKYPEGGYGYLYRAEDYTNLSAILSGEAAPAEYETMILTRIPDPTATPEETAAEAQAASIEDSILAHFGSELLSRAESAGYGINISTDRDTGALRQILIEPPYNLKFSDVDQDLMRDLFAACLTLPEFELSQDAIDGFLSYSFGKRFDDTKEGLWVQYIEKPFGGLVLNINPE